MPERAALLPMVALLLAIGAFAGVIAGLPGVGGGIVLVPAVFFSFTHLGQGGPQLIQVCIATSLATIVFTLARSVLAHNRTGAVDWATLRGWASCIVGGAILGVLAAASGFGILIALPSVVGFLLLPVADSPPHTIGAVNLPAFLIFMATTMTTTTLGARPAHARDPKPLNRVFALFLSLGALTMRRRVAAW